VTNAAAGQRTDPLGGLQRSSRPPSRNRGGVLLLSEGKGKGEERRGKGRGKGIGRGRQRDGISPSLFNFWLC